jgi:hypothetical protein
MDWTRAHPSDSPSGGHRPVPSAGVVSPVILRLLPYLPHPPARVGVHAGQGATASALTARGYRVVGGPQSPLAGWDLPVPLDALCEAGEFRAVPPEARPRWAALVALAVRPGGRLFGAFASGEATSGGRAPWSVTASELATLLGASFDIERLDTSAFADPDGTPLLEAVFVRR